MWIPLRIYGALKPRVIASSPLAYAHNFAECFITLLNNFARSNTRKTQQISPRITAERFAMHRDVAHAKRVQSLHPHIAQPPRSLCNVITPQRISSRNNNIKPHMFAWGKEHNSTTTATTHYLNIVAITLINIEK
jgi:hypothetical protein